MKLRILLLAVCLVMVFPLQSQAKTLHIVTLSSAPLAFEQNGEVVGIATDLVREGLNRIGHNAVIRIVPWIRGLNMVRFGDADAIFPAGYNAERTEWFHYPASHLFEVQAVPIKRTDDPLVFSLSRLDYSDYTLGDVRGGYFGPHHKSFMEKARFKGTEMTSSTPPNLKKLRDKRIDLFITTYHEARYMIRTMGLSDDLTVIRREDGTPLFIDKSQVHLAFSKKRFSGAMSRQFSDAILSMKLDGTYDRIIKKYLDP